MLNYQLNITLTILISSLALTGPVLGDEKIFNEVEKTVPFFEHGKVIFNTSMPDNGTTHYFTDNRGFEWGPTTIYERNFQGKLTALRLPGMKIPADVHITPDGKTLYFTDYGDNPSRIYKTHRKNGEWVKPIIENKLPEGSGYLTTTYSGAIYYSYQGDIYRLKDGKNEKLPEAINTDIGEHDPFIAQDESFLIFVRQDTQTDSNMYLSIPVKNGWTKAEKLPSPFNESKVDGSPYVTPDRQYLFFSSNRDGEVVKTWQAPIRNWLQARLK